MTRSEKFLLYVTWVMACVSLVSIVTINHTVKTINETVSILVERSGKK